VVFEAITKPISEALAPLFGMKPEELQPKLEGIIWLIILAIGAVIAFKILRKFVF